MRKGESGDENSRRLEFLEKFYLEVPFTELARKYNRAFRSSLSEREIWETLLSGRLTFSPRPMMPWEDFEVIRADCASNKPVHLMRLYGLIRKRGSFNVTRPTFVKWLKELGLGQFLKHRHCWTDGQNSLLYTNWKSKVPFKKIVDKLRVGFGVKLTVGQLKRQTGLMGKLKWDSACGKSFNEFRGMGKAVHEPVAAMNLPPESRE
jgi:hypothetical protein